MFFMITKNVQPGSYKKIYTTMSAFKIAVKFFSFSKTLFKKS